MKAQGLPMSTLVIGALALLVLIGVATMWISGGSSIFEGFAQITGGATPSTISQAKTACKSFCADLKIVEPTYTQLMSHNFCSKTYDLSDEGGTTADHCFDLDTISEECTFAASDGRMHTVLLHSTFACDSPAVISSW